MAKEMSETNANILILNEIADNLQVTLKYLDSNDSKSQKTIPPLFKDEVKKIILETQEYKNGNSGDESDADRWIIALGKLSRQEEEPESDISSFAEYENSIFKYKADLNKCMNESKDKLAKVLCLSLYARRFAQR